MVGGRSDWESRDVPKVARGGLLFQSTADRLEGLEGVEVRLGVVEEVASRRGRLWRGKGLTTLSPVSRALSGMSSSLAEVLVWPGSFSVIPSCPLFRLFS